MVQAVGNRTDLVVVAQSIAGLTAPLLCDRLPVKLIVLVAAMMPAPGETPGEWWTNTGHAEAKREQAERDGRITGEDDDLQTPFLHEYRPTW